MTVGRNRDARLRRRNPADSGIAPQDPLRTGDRTPELGCARLQLPRVDHDLQRIGAGAGEVAIDLLARQDGLGAVGLPAGAGERRLHSRGEDAETDGDHAPRR